MNKIYKKVKTIEDYDLYYDILIPSWTEMDYTLECLLGDVSRYIIFNQSNQPVGTLEMIPYVPLKSSDLDNYFPFREEKEIKDNIDRTVELDNVSIDPKYRRQENIDRIGYTIVEYARVSHMKYGIALMNPMLYLALRNTYKLPVRKLGRKITKNESISVYPVIIDIESIYNNLEKYPWLYHIYECKQNVARKVISYQNRDLELSIK